MNALVLVPAVAHILHSIYHLIITAEFSPALNSGAKKEEYVKGVVMKAIDELSPDIVLPPNQKDEFRAELAERVVSDIRSAVATLNETRMFTHSKNKD